MSIKSKAVFMRFSCGRWLEARTIGQTGGGVAAATDRFRSFSDILRRLSAAPREPVDPLARDLERLLDDTFLPAVVVRVEHVAQLLLDARRQIRRRLGMQLQPLVGAQGVEHLEDRLRAVLERDAGVFGLRAFL